MSNIERQNKLRKLQHKQVNAEQKLSMARAEYKKTKEGHLKLKIKQLENSMVSRQRRINQLKDSRHDFQEVKDWKRATGWVNKKVENPNWKAQQDQRRYSGSLGTAMWGYNKEEYIKSMNRGEEPEPFDDGTH